MGSPETSERNSKLKKLAAGAFFGLAVVIVVWQTMPRRTVVSTGVYFSSDDGKSWFIDDVAQCPPFDHDGKEAVRCMVFTAGGSPYAGYLLKYSASVRDKMMHNIPCAGAELKRGTMVKRPGDATWITLADSGAPQILAGTDPGHPSATPTQISP